MPESAPDAEESVARVHEVFVYGTLRPGMSNAHVARAARAEVVEHAWADGLVMYALEPEGYPAAVPGPGRLRGCVLRLPGLAPFDALEEVDARPPLYVRRRWPVAGRPVWIYLYAREARLRQDGARRVPSGDWAGVVAGGGSRPASRTDLP